MKIRNERFVNVPLCATHCTMWFEACKRDFTCTDNWTRNFRWKNGTNHCPAGAPCFTFEQVYQTAENFCEKVTADARTGERALCRRRRGGRGGDGLSAGWGRTVG